MGVASSCCGLDTNNDPRNEKKHSSLPIIAVLGVTGSQGGAVVRALSKSGLYRIHGLTRNPNSDKAKLIMTEHKNVTMIEADLNNIESLKQAFSSVYGVFGVTFYWNHMDPAKEYQQVKNLVEAAKACDVKHFVWSTLEDTRILIQKFNKNDEFPTLQNKYKVPHLDVKGESDKLFKEYDIPTTFVITSFYWQNFIYFGMGPKASDQKDDEFIITAPMENKLIGMNLDTLGIAVLNILKKGVQLMANQYVGVCDDMLSYQEMCDKMSKKLNKSIRFNYVKPEIYAKFGFPGCEDLANMFKYFDVFSEQCKQKRNYKQLTEICPELSQTLTGFDAFLEQMGDKIPFSSK